MLSWLPLSTDRSKATPDMIDTDRNTTAKSETHTNSAGSSYACTARQSLKYLN
jgi:hypothetical protein